MPSATGRGGRTRWRTIPLVTPRRSSLARVWWAHRMLLSSVLFLSIGSVTGCGSDHAFPSAPITVKQYWRLALNHHAVALALTAPANQLQLSAVPLTATGDTLATDARVQFISSDSAVQVDSTGLLTAHSPKTGVLVIATLTVGGIQGLTLADTAQINVNSVSPVPVFAHFEVHTPGDSARIPQKLPGGGALDALVVTIADSVGTPISGTNFYVAVRDTTVTGFTQFSQGGHWSGKLTGSGVGQTQVIVESTVYGISKSDTLTMHVGAPVFQIVPLQQTSDTTAQFAPPTVSLSPGGIVVFENQTAGAIDLLFDDSTAVESATYDQISVASVYYCFYFLACPAAGSGAGNISALPPLDALRKHKVGMEFRRFVRPGVYSFQSRPFHAHGVIHVE